TRSYSYSTTGRLTGVHTTTSTLDIRIPYATDPAGNRLPDPELHPDSTLSMWPDNRIARDAHYLYRYVRIPLYSITDWHRSPISDSHPFDQPGT
ncbi:rhsC element core RshC domain protein, partial [Escherichia coli 2-011-08_S1_C2]